MVKVIAISIILFCMSIEPVYTYEEKTRTEVEVSDDIYDRAKEAFCSLIEEEETKNMFIPSQTQVLEVQWDGNNLSVDVSKDIRSYSGGTAIEHEIMCQLLNTAFSIKGVQSFTLLIEGEEAYLPEGTQILGYTRQRYLANVAIY